MAAARNYVQTLNLELAGRGIFAGTLHIAAVIEGSAGHRAMTSGALDIDLSHVPIVDPADLADLLWSMLTTRDRADVLFP